jgi:hypothetical protein
MDRPIVEGRTYDMSYLRKNIEKVGSTPPAILREPTFRDIQQPGNAVTQIQNITQWSEEPATSAKKVRKNLFLCKP